jgi:thiosulfate reductase cytochrome b subunit
MVVASFIFGLVVIAFSLIFLLLYVQSNKSMRENHSALVRQREQQRKFQADLQARMEMDARKYEEARQALLKQAGGKDDSKRRNIEHAA